MIHQAGAGPKPIPQRELCVDNLSDALVELLSEPAKVAARHIAEQIRDEVYPLYTADSSSSLV